MATHRMILALDAGGTKCDALVCTDQGEVVRWVRSVARGDEEPYAGGFGRSNCAFQRVLAALPDFPPGVELHLGGFGSPFEMGAGAPIVVHAVQEWQGPRALVAEHHGILAIAGTGALVHGVDDDGTQHLLDGLGPLYGDHGSAFQIGLAALRAVGRSGWADRHRTVLAETVPEACAQIAGLPDVNLVEFLLQNRNRDEIASLARLVDEAAIAEDSVSYSILDRAAGDLAETVRDMAASLGWSEQRVPIIGSGSVLIRSDRYWASFCEQVQKFLPHAQFKRVQRDPVFGVALAVAEQLDLGRSFRETLLGSNAEPWLA